MKHQTIYQRFSLFVLVLSITVGSGISQAKTRAIATWINGSDTIRSLGVYGTKGVPDPNNTPGARYNSTSWTDETDNVWLFGGYGYPRFGSWGYLNDLWKFDGNQWIWISGPDATNQIGVYGTKGIPESTNMPGARDRSTSWTDDAGNLWLFGGYGYGSTPSVGPLNDLWKFDGDNWTWFSGLNTVHNNGIYGIQGETDPNNIPGSRYGSISWTDDNGNLWLFGGYGYDSGGNYSNLNDLWKFDGINWTWISGSNTANANGVYGIKGIVNPANVPGARHHAISWKDKEGNLWLFGGFGYPSEGSWSRLNDLWKFDGDNWTWVSGSHTGNENGVYGIQGVADPTNMPGAREKSTSWVDKKSNLWLFGGYGRDSEGGNGELNDLWKFDGNQWIWISGSDAIKSVGVYGIQGISDSTNIPGARYNSVSWIDSVGNLWLFSGWGFPNEGDASVLNDLWKFEIYESYDLMDFAGFASAWSSEEGELQYDPACDFVTSLEYRIDVLDLDVFCENWLSPTIVDAMWASGSNLRKQLGVYGIKGLSDPNNIPGCRWESISWTDGNGNLWLFGGSGYSNEGNYGYLNDLWKYDGANWTWISGSNTINENGIYGTKGIADPANIPSGRYQSVSWIDASGNLWLFGGGGYDGAGNSGKLNDLWKYDGANWTWISGSDMVNEPGVHGVQGIPDPNNIPSARNGSISWKDEGDNLWLLGGFGYLKGGGTGRLNDLWKFDGINWTWMGGSDEIQTVGIYGTRGVPDPANIPGGRWSSISWMTEAGDLWLLGGNGYDSEGQYGELNDLWKFDGINWTWISGSNVMGEKGVYGIQGLPDPNNIPGARNSSISWMDKAGNLWLFGGYGSDSAGDSGDLNDFWKYDGANWTWISGSNIVNENGIYGTKGIADPANIPGARKGSISWTDANANLWVFGGSGYDSIGNPGQLNDLWKFELSQSSNMKNFADFASAWFSRDGDTSYDPTCDLVTPEIHAIDILDLCVFCEHWLAKP